MPRPFTRELVDLHIHVGASLAPHVLWGMAHNQGYKLPVKDYWAFVDLVSADAQGVHSLESYLKILHEVTERIQSSPAAIERSVYEIIGKEYRGSWVTQIELRFNPMKRNQGGERDLDHIIHAALRGMDRACLEYGVKAGLIFCLAREFEPRLNEIILQKAIRYRSRGVVGIDLAGTEKGAVELKEDEVLRYRDIYAEARAAGLKTTVHTGETRHTSGEGVAAAIEHLKPHRIGHGIRAAYSDSAMKVIRETGTVLEICPTSNLKTSAVEDMSELGHILRTFRDRKVRYTINTDGTYMLGTDMRREVQILLDHGIVDDDEVDRCLATAREASFIPPV
jgi:adenosine deaminase